MMMHLIRRSFFVPALALALLAGCAAPSPANLGDAKTRLVAYHDSGQYLKDVAALDTEAEAYIRDLIPKTAKPAIVLDIDETSLSNWPELRANDLTFRMRGPCSHLPAGPCGLVAWQQQARAPGIAPTVNLAEAAQRAGAAVFFITGRDERLRHATELNLRRAGYKDWKALLMRPAGSHTRSAADYKAPQREKIEKQGYTIIANIGDQPSDLAGGYAERGFLVPDPFYRIP
jgi:acid phosphatase